MTDPREPLDVMTQPPPPAASRIRQAMAALRERVGAVPALLFAPARAACCPARPIRTPRRISPRSSACCPSPGRSSAWHRRAGAWRRALAGAALAGGGHARRRRARARDRRVPRGRAGRRRPTASAAGIGRRAGSRSCATAASAPMAAAALVLSLLLRVALLAASGRALGRGRCRRWRCIASGAVSRAAGLVPVWAAAQCTDATAARPSVGRPADRTMVIASLLALGIAPAAARALLGVPSAVLGDRPGCPGGVARLPAVPPHDRRPDRRRRRRDDAAGRPRCC